MSSIFFEEEIDLLANGIKKGIEEFRQPKDESKAFFQNQQADTDDDAGVDLDKLSDTRSITTNVLFSDTDNTDGVDISIMDGYNTPCVSIDPDPGVDLEQLAIKVTDYTFLQKDVTDYGDESEYGIDFDVRKQKEKELQLEVYQVKKLKLEQAKKELEQSDKEVQLYLKKIADCESHELNSLSEELYKAKKLNEEVAERYKKLIALDKPSNPFQNQKINLRKLKWSENTSLKDKVQSITGIDPTMFYESNDK